MEATARSAPMPCSPRRARRHRRPAVLVLAHLALVATAAAQPVVPTDGMVITTSTTFVTGTYSLPHGVSIGASNITLDMNGATLVGTGFNNYGVTCIGFSNVTIRNGACRTYFYGMRAENGSGIQILDNDLSLNYVDPSSQTNNP